jgi:hypothetical protein
LLNPQANGECGIISDLSFGSTRPSTSYDPDILTGFNVRPSQWEFSGSVQHELTPRMGLNVGYFRRMYSNFTVPDNRAAAATDYTAFGFTAPVNPDLPDGGGYPVSGYYNLNPNKVGQVDNFVTAASKFGDQYEHWNGVDVSLNMRFQNLRIQGGTSTGRTSTDNCEVAAKLPEVLVALAFPVTAPATVAQSINQCHQDTAWLTQVKGLAFYTIPKIDVSVSGTVQSTAGPQLLASYVATNAVVQPSLGRPLSGGAANATVAIIDPGTEYGARINQLDFRVAKNFRTSRGRTAVNFDIYNVLNSNPITIVNNNDPANGVGWQTPQGILPARLFKFSVQFTY